MMKNPRTVHAAYTHHNGIFIPQLATADSAIVWSSLEQPYNAAKALLIANTFLAANPNKYHSE
jgi:hypothetical protein